MNVTREEYPCHFAAADECGGTVEPFDVYQGPYVHVSGRGRFWLTGEWDGCQWWSEQTGELSYGFFLDEEIAANALAELIAFGGTRVADLPLAEDAARLTDIGEL